MQCNGASLPANASRPRVAQTALEPTHQPSSVCGDLESGGTNKQYAPGNQGPLPLSLPRPREMPRMPLVHHTHPPHTSNTRLDNIARPYFAKARHYRHHLRVVAQGSQHVGQTPSCCVCLQLPPQEFLDGIHRLTRHMMFTVKPCSAKLP